MITKANSIGLYCWIIPHSLVSYVTLRCTTGIHCHIKLQHKLCDKQCYVNTDYCLTHSTESAPFKQKQCLTCIIVQHYTGRYTISVRIAVKIIT